jgi:hypothetical protein
MMITHPDQFRAMTTELEQLNARAEAAEQWQHTFAGLGGTPEIAWAFYKGLENNKIAWQQRAEDAEARVAELERDNDRLIEAGDLLVASESLEVGWHEAVAAWQELKEASQ